MSYPMRVGDHMMQAPYFLDIGTSVAEAARSLREWHVDFAPVLELGKLYGLIAARDLVLSRELGSADHSVRLRDVPLRQVYVTTPDAALPRVARAMAAQKLDCALVQDGETLLGLLTLHEATSALLDLSGLDDLAPLETSGAEVRSLILLEHANVRRLLRRVERSAHRILASPFPLDADLTEAYESAHTLCLVMASELELEDHLLAPALEAVDAWGKVRADRMRVEHAQQTLVLRSYLRALERLSASDRAGQVLVALVQQLVDGLQDHLLRDEAHILRADLLSDLPLTSVVETG